MFLKDKKIFFPLIGLLGLFPSTSIAIPCGGEIYQADANLLYAVHDDGRNDSHFFALSLGDLSVEPLGAPYPQYDIEGLDINPANKEIYAASGDDTANPGYLYKVKPCALNAIGPIQENGHHFKEVDALSFRPTDASLWAWAQGEGLIVINPSTGQANLIEAHSGEIEDLTWNTTGEILYAVENVHAVANPDAELDSNSTHVLLWAYDGNTATIACEQQLEGSLEIEALETLPDDTLLFGFHEGEQLLVGTITPSTCEVNYVREIDVPYSDIEGVGLLDQTSTFVDFTGRIASVNDTYRIIAQDDKTYSPRYLPEIFQQDDLQIDVKAKIFNLDRLVIDIVQVNTHNDIGGFTAGFGPNLVRLGGTTAYVPMEHDFAETDPGEPDDPNALTHVLATASGNEDIDFIVGMSCPAGKTVVYLRVDNDPPIGNPLDESGDLVNADTGQATYSTVVALKPFPKDWLEYACRNAMGGDFPADSHPAFGEIVQTDLQTSILVTGQCSGSITEERYFPISLAVDCKDLDYPY